MIVQFSMQYYQWRDNLHPDVAAAHIFKHPLNISKAFNKIAKVNNRGDFWYQNSYSQISLSYISEWKTCVDIIIIWYNQSLLVWVTNSISLRRTIWHRPKHKSPLSSTFICSLRRDNIYQNMMTISDDTLQI